MFRKQLIAAATVLLGLAVGPSAFAGSIDFTFQPCGNNTCAIAASHTLDWVPGNVLSLGGSGGGSLLPIGTTVTDLFQANLGVLLAGGGGTLFSNGTVSDGSTRFFTVVAGFGETVNGAAPLPPAGGVNSFTFGGGTANFFTVYANTIAAGNNLAGTGFVAGTAILSGVITSVSSSVTVAPAFADGFGCGSPLDGNGANNYPGVTTICTTGASTVTAKVTSANANYFPDLPVGLQLVFALTNSSLITPFNQVDPSAKFSSNGIADGDTAQGIGTLNGISGPNFQFQADANTSFSVPEPGTLALLGITLAGFGAVARRRRK